MLTRYRSLPVREEKTCSATAVNSSAWCEPQTHSPAARSRKGEPNEDLKVRESTDKVAPPSGGAGDEALMAAYNAGDARAFDTLYERHKGALYRYFLRQVDRDAANDCFQVLWLKVIDNRHRYRPDAPFKHYLYTLAHNALMDHHRKHRRTVAAVDDPLETSIEDEGTQVAVQMADLPQLVRTSGSDPALVVDGQRLLDALHRLIQNLPLHQREVWLLRQETDLSVEEIAQVTRATAEGVKSRLRYAKDKLKAGMARYAERN